MTGKIFKWLFKESSLYNKSLKYMEKETV